MKRILIGITTFIGALLIFTGGVYASQWLNFTGDEQITQSDDHLDEIMDILRNVNQDKITAEDALAELEAMNPPGLVKKIKELEDLVAQLEGTIELRDHTIEGLEADVADLEHQLANAPEDQTEYVKHLEEQLQIANEAVEQHNATTSEAVEEARNYGGDE